MTTMTEEPRIPKTMKAAVFYKVGGGMAIQGPDLGRKVNRL